MYRIRVSKSPCNNIQYLVTCKKHNTKILSSLSHSQYTFNIKRQRQTSPQKLSCMIGASTHTTEALPMTSYNRYCWKNQWINLLLLNTSACVLRKNVWQFEFRLFHFLQINLLRRYLLGHASNLTSLSMYYFNLKKFLKQPKI